MSRSKVVIFPNRVSFPKPFLVLQILKLESSDLWSPHELGRRDFSFQSSKIPLNLKPKINLKERLATTPRTSSLQGAHIMGTISWPKGE